MAKDCSSKSTKAEGKHEAKETSNAKSSGKIGVRKSRSQEWARSSECCKMAIRRKIATTMILVGMAR